MRYYVIFFLGLLAFWAFLGFATFQAGLRAIGAAGF